MQSSIKYTIVTVKVIVLLCILELSVSRLLVKDKCVSLYEECSVDGDCCRTGKGQPIRCETRHQVWGKRCYETRQIHMPCTENSQCVSQNCESGHCAFNQQIVVKKMCELTAPDDVEEVVNGFPAAHTCPCEHPPMSVKDAMMAMDHDMSTDYVNYNTPYSGLIINPMYTIPVKKMQVCSSNDSSDCGSACDPLCYRIEAKNDEDDFQLLQRGNIDFQENERNSCVDIAVTGRQMFKFYNVTFGCRRGGYRECNHQSSSCEHYAIKVSEVSLWGSCDEI